MGKLEQELLESKDLVPSVLLRFLDDIFMVLDHYLESLHMFFRCSQFFSYYNQIYRSIKKVISLRNISKVFSHFSYINGLCFTII